MRRDAGEGTQDVGEVGIGKLRNGSVQRTPGGAIDAETPHGGVEVPMQQGRRIIIKGMRERITRVGPFEAVVLETQRP